MFKSKKNDPFFGMLIKLGSGASKATDLLKIIMDEGTVTKDNEKMMFHIEESCDEVYKEIIDRLNKTFVTPIDREDIYSLSNMVEELVDMHENIVELMVSYRIASVPEGIVHMTAMLDECACEIARSMEWLRDLRDNKRKILDHAIKIVALEDQSDKLYYREIAKLFDQRVDPYELIKYRDILTKLESMLNHCEKIAELFRGVVMKYA